MKVVVLFSLLSAAVPVFATVIVQKNGDVISGRILEEKTDKYIFQSPYGKLQIAKTNVAKLILDEKTIELKNVTVGDKTVKARLVNQDKETSVYLTEDGRTIRKDEKEEKPQPKAELEPAKKELPKEAARDKILVALSGVYGFSTFPRESTEPGNPADRAFEQAFHGSTLGLQVSGHYALSRYFGLGLGGAFLRSAASVDVQTAAGQPGSRESNAVNTSLVVAPSAMFSVLGNLGSTVSAHDLRLEVQGGVNFNSSEMLLTYKNSPGFPASSVAEGNKIAPTFGTQAYYCYSFSESFRLKVGIGYFITLLNKPYEGTLQNPPAAGAFKTDFENTLGKTISNPRVVSLVLGFEIGF